jgi:hypothetical protein
MSARVAKRLLTLGCVALLAAVTAIAVLHRLDLRNEPPTGQAGAVAPGAAGWFSALAASRGLPGDAERTTCDLVLTARSLGVTHPVLPCGAKVLIQYGSRTVFTEVIDNRLKGQGRQFELTDRLARTLAIDGTQAIQWRFALPPSG